MRLLVDLDDTLVPMNKHVLEEVNKELGTDYSLSDLDTYNYYEVLPDDHADYIMELWHHENLYDMLDIEPSPKALAYLDMLRKYYDDGVYIVSHTLSGHATSKMKFLESFSDFYDGYVLTEHKHLVEGDVVIDDAPKHVEQFSDKKFIMMDHPYNHNVSNDKIFGRAYCWHDVFDLALSALENRGKQLLANYERHTHTVGDST